MIYLDNQLYCKKMLDKPMLGKFITEALPVLLSVFGNRNVLYFDLTLYLPRGWYVAAKLILNKKLT